MDSPLKESTRVKARELAAGITVAHELDPEIQEELYGHIEDKLLAYKNGEEPVSEEDALILAREHFGDTATLKGMFHDVHHDMANEGLLRRLLVAVITTLVCAQGVSWLALCLEILIGGTGPRVYPGLYVTHGVSAFSLLLPCLFYLRWQRQLRKGKPAWFCRWKTSALAALALGLFATGLVVPGIWSPLKGAVFFQYLLPSLYFQSISPHSPVDYFYLPALFLLANVMLFGVLVWAGMRLKGYRQRDMGADRRSRTLTVLYLWSIIVLLGFVNLGVGAFFQGSDARVLIPFGLILLPWAFVVLVCCSSWVWWCDSPPRLTRNTAKVALAWWGFTALYAAISSLRVSFGLGEAGFLDGIGVLWLKLRVPGTDVWCYLARSHYEFHYDMARLPGLAVYAVFFAIIVTLSFRVTSGVKHVAIEGEKV